MRKPKRKKPTKGQLSLDKGDVVKVTRDDGRTESRPVRVAPWQLGDGTWVVGLDGISGGYLLTRCTPEKASPAR